MILRGGYWCVRVSAIAPILSIRPRLFYSQANTYTSAYAAPNKAALLRHDSGWRADAAPELAVTFKCWSE